MDQKAKDYDKQFKTSIEQVNHDFAAFIKAINGKRPTPYIEAKHLELYERIMRTCNDINKLLRHILQLKMDINERKQKMKNDAQQKAETDALIIRLFDLEQMHKSIKERFQLRMCQILQIKMLQHWGPVEFGYCHKFEVCCATCVSRIM